jgi:hypothetical protein
MRLQAEGVPDSADRHPAESGGFRQATRGPMRFSARRCLQCLNHHLLYLRIAHRARRSGPWFVIQRFQAALKKPSAPLAYHAHRAPQLPRYRLIVQPLGARQYDPRSPRQKRLTPRPMCQRFQSLALFLDYGQRLLGSASAHLRSP